MHVQQQMLSYDLFGCQTSNAPPSCKKRPFCKVVVSMVSQSCTIIILSWLTTNPLSLCGCFLWILSLIDLHLGNFFCKSFETLCGCLIFSPCGIGQFTLKVFHQLLYSPSLEKCTNDTCQREATLFITKNLHCIHFSNHQQQWFEANHGERHKHTPLMQQTSQTLQAHVISHQAMLGWQLLFFVTPF